MSRGEFRQYPVGFFRDTAFVGLTPLAKATYFAVQSQLPSFGLGTLVPQALHAIVGCSPGELESALDELSPIWLRNDGRVFRLRGVEEAQNWGSPKYQEYYRRNMNDMPPSAVVDEFIADINDRIRRRENAKQSKRGVAQSPPMPTKRAASSNSEKRKERAAHTVSIQEEKEEEIDKSLLFRKEVDVAHTVVACASSDSSVYDSLLFDAYGDDAEPFNTTELDALNKLEGNGGDEPVLMRLGRLMQYVPRDQLTVDELRARWDELGGDNPAPF